jgi:thioredoxin reductase (NADPH)
LSKNVASFWPVQVGSASPAKSETKKGEKMSTEKVIIVGSGPAGLTAAIYAARADLKPLCIEGYQAGGQLMLTSDVENYPGYPNGVLGPEMMQDLRKQAERFGTRFITKDVTKVDFSRKPFEVMIGEERYSADVIIASTGSSAMWLGLESETKLRGRGVSSCATCDGAFFRDQKIVVVGGGDTAIEEATFLTKFASHVTVVHRRNQLRASKIMQERAKSNEKISFVWDSVIEEVLGEDGVEGVRVKNVKSNEGSTVECKGLFIAIGHKPNTEIFKGQLALDEVGYILTTDNTRTSVPGVFACGDVQDHRYRQAITAAGSGCMAAIDAERHLEDAFHK